MRRLLIGCMLLATSVASASQSQTAPAALRTSCQQVLAGSNADLAQIAEAKRGAYADKRPRFVTPAQDQQIAQQWKGEEGPRFFQMALPEGVNFIDHELIGSEGPGVVKMMQDDGQFMMLRLQMPWNGRTISTNVTVSNFGLVENMRRVVSGGTGAPMHLGTGASAVIFYKHGGGSNTSNSSTSEGAMSALAKNNIVVVAIDEPQHGEGDRGWFKDEEDYLRFQVAFRERFIDPEVPTFLDGHSMGGEIADIAFRRSDRPELGLAHAFRGFINLSGVPDMAPGRDLAAKTRAEAVFSEKQKQPPMAQMLSDFDRNLGLELMRKGKLSINCELQCLFLARHNDWSLIPQPTNYRGTGRPVVNLVLSGQYDSLVWGRDEIVERHQLNLPNTEFAFAGARVNFAGEVEPVGHMISDHLMPVENSPEATAIIRDWLMAENSALSGKSDVELAEIFRKQMVKPYSVSYAFGLKENSYPSAMILTPYHFDPKFHAFVDRRISARSVAAGEVDMDGDPITQDMAFDQARRKYFMQFAAMKGKDDPIFETMDAIRNFILKTIAGDGAASESTRPPSSDELRALKYYANVITFREYLQKYEYNKPQPTANYIAMMKLISPDDEFRDSVDSYVKKVNGISRAKNLTDEQKKTQIAAEPIPKDASGHNLGWKEAVQISQSPRAGIDAYVRRVESIQNNGSMSEEEKGRNVAAIPPVRAANGQELTPEEAIRFSKFASAIARRDLIPEGSLKDFAEENLQARQVNRDRTRDAVVQMKTLKSDMDSQRKTLRRLEGKLNRILTEDHPEELNKQAEMLQAEEGRLETSAEEATTHLQGQIIADDVAMIQRSFDEIVEGFSSETEALMVQWDTDMRTYLKHKAELDTAKRDAALAGKYGLAAQTYARRLSSQGGEIAKMDGLLEHMEQLAFTLRSLSVEKDQLMQAYIEKILPDYFRYETVRAWDVLQDPTRFSEAPFYLKEALSQFILEIWGHRPPPQKTGLYG